MANSLVRPSSLPEVSVYDAESGLFKNGTPLTVAAATTTDRPIAGMGFCVSPSLPHSHFSASLNDAFYILLLRVTTMGFAMVMLQNPGYKFGEICVYKLIASHLRRPM